MLIGLFFAMLGDILLEIQFMVGAGFFAIGHILFIVAYYFVERFHWLDLLIGGILALTSALIVTLVPIFDFGSLMLEILIVFYAIIISFMLGKAVSNLIRKRNILNLMIMIGSFLFFFSDLMLLLGIFGNIDVSVLCLATYYPATTILALSLMFAKREEFKVVENIANHQ